MAYDALTMRSVTCELNQTLAGGRVNRITQTSRFDVVLQIHARGNNYKLLLSAHPQQGGVYLTRSTAGALDTTPMFCVLLRKHLEGFRIDRIFQKDLERVMVFVLSGTDETGLQAERWLVAEIMGKHSNLILSYPDGGNIIDSIRRVSHQVSRVREILPGIPYVWPPPQNRSMPFGLSEADFCLHLQERAESERLWKALLATFEGLGPLSAKEICVRGGQDPDQRMGCLDGADRQNLYEGFRRFWHMLEKEEYASTLVIHPNEQKALAYAPYPLQQYPRDWHRSFSQMNSLLEEYFTRWAGVDRLEEARSALLRSIQQHTERVRNRIAAIQISLREAEKADELRAWGEIILANVHRIQKGDQTVAGPDYRQDPDHMITVPLDPQKSPPENAQLYFRRYSKAKKSLAIQSRQLRFAQQELDYLESTLISIENADSTVLLREIRSELEDEGYLKEQRGSRRRKQQPDKPAQPLEIQDPSGYRILIGRNNRQNDLLTMRLARSDDLWLHAKDIPGSHVIVQLQNNSEFSDAVIARAASLAAYFSQARQGNKVPVDYTLRRHVRKPRGAKPGMVIYDHQKTILAAPEKPPSPGE